MTRLVLKLGPKERLLINGAVLENGDRRSRVTVLTSNAKILRLKDAIHPDDANTPVKRACYFTQLLLSGDIETEDARHHLLHQLDALGHVFHDDQGKDLIRTARKFFENGNAYSCLKSLRQLLPLEAQLLSKKH